MTVATDTDPLYALPRLYGAPAYARPPKVVPASERPINPDDLPIAAEQTDEERAVARELHASGSYRAGSGMYAAGAAHGPAQGEHHPREGVAGRRFSLRALTDRLAPRSK